MNRWGALFAAVAFSLLGLSLGGLELLYMWRVKPLLTENRAVQSKYQTAYEEDLDYLAKSSLAGIIETPQMLNDASAFLNSKLYWSPKPNKVTGGIAKPIVDSETNEKILRLRSQWMTIADKRRSVPIDLSFLDRLGGYDHWNIEANSPITQLIEKARFVPPPQLPIPETNDIVSAVKVRLIQGALDNRPIEALQAARDLARLLLTTENIQLVLTGLAVLDHERTAYRYYVDNLKFSDKSWTPIDRNVTRRAQRAILATRSYLRLWTDESYLEKYFLGQTKTLMLCAVTNEAMPLEFSLRPVLEPTLPLEIDVKHEYARLDQIYERAKSNCRLRYLTRLVDAKHFADDLPGLLLLNRLPYSRKIFGLRLSAANFDGFSGYAGIDTDRAPGSGDE